MPTEIQIVVENWMKSRPIMIDIDIKHFSLHSLLPMTSFLLPSLTISCWHFPGLCFQPVSLPYTLASCRRVTTSSRVVSVWAQYHPLHRGQPSPSHIVARARAHMSPCSPVTKLWGCSFSLISQVWPFSSCLITINIITIIIITIIKEAALLTIFQLLNC